MGTNADILYFDKDCPLDAVVSLAEPRDVGGLNGAFLSILKEHIPQRAVKVYELYSSNGYPAKDTDNQSLRLILKTCENNVAVKLEMDDEDVRKSIAENKVVTGKSTTSGLERTIFPIPGLPDPVGLLVIEGRVDESCKNFLDPLLRIYASHAYLLNRNEHDSLTGLFNRHVMENKLNQIYYCQANGKRQNDNQQQTWAIALLDIDYFKMINDQYGHLFGDEVLVLFSRLLQHSFRDEDLLFRYGGEEFLVVLKNVDIEKARHTLNRFREKVAQTSFNKLNQLTVSIGFTILDTNQSLQTVVERADRALYYSKFQGRNQTHCYERLCDKGLVEECKDSLNNIKLFPQQQKIS